MYRMLVAEPVRIELPGKQVYIRWILVIVGWIHLSQDRDKWHELVSATIKQGSN